MTAFTASRIGEDCPGYLNYHTFLRASVIADPSAERRHGRLHDQDEIGLDWACVGSDFAQGDLCRIEFMQQSSV